MKTYYYIAYRKPRNQKPKYAGDGYIDAESRDEAWQLLNHGKGCLSKKYTKIRLKDA